MRMPAERRLSASELPAPQEQAAESAPEPEQAQELKSDLEVGPQWDEYLNELGDGTGLRQSAEADDKELPSYDQTLTRLPTLSDHLLWQLHLSTSDPASAKGGEWIIGNLDEDGYLRATLEEVAQQSGIARPDMERALGLDPGLRSDGCRRARPAGMSAHPGETTGLAGHARGEDHPGASPGPGKEKVSPHRQGP